MVYLILPTWRMLSSGVCNLSGKCAYSTLAVISSDSTANNLRSVCASSNQSVLFYPNGGQIPSIRQGHCNWQDFTLFATVKLFEAHTCFSLASVGGLGIPARKSRPLPQSMPAPLPPIMLRLWENKRQKKTKIHGVAPEFDSWGVSLADFHIARGNFHLPHECL